MPVASLTPSICRMTLTPLFRCSPDRIDQPRFGLFLFHAIRRIEFGLLLMLCLCNCSRVRKSSLRYRSRCGPILSIHDSHTLLVGLFRANTHVGAKYGITIHRNIEPSLSVTVAFAFFSFSKNIRTLSSRFLFHFFTCYSVCRRERTSWRKQCKESSSSERNRVQNGIYFNRFSIANIDSQITEVIYVL